MGIAAAMLGGKVFKDEIHKVADERQHVHEKIQIDHPEKTVTIHSVLCDAGFFMHVPVAIDPKDDAIKPQREPRV